MTFPLEIVTICQLYMIHAELFERKFSPWSEVGVIAVFFIGKGWDISVESAIPEGIVRIADFVIATS